MFEWLALLPSSRRGNLSGTSMLRWGEVRAVQPASICPDDDGISCSVWSIYRASYDIEGS